MPGLEFDQGRSVFFWRGGRFDEDLEGLITLVIMLVPEVIM